MPNKFQLGERVRYSAYMWRCDTDKGKVWRKILYRAEGIIVGKRTVSDGHTENWGEGNVYTATGYHSFWLVAHNLCSYRYVAEADIEAVEVAKEGGIDGYEWSNTTSHSLAMKEGEGNR